MTPADLLAATSLACAAGFFLLLPRIALPAAVYILGCLLAVGSQLLATADAGDFLAGLGAELLPPLAMRRMIHNNDKDNHG